MGEVVDSREFTVNLNTGAVIDWSVVTLGSHWSVLLILSSLIGQVCDHCGELRSPECPGDPWLVCGIRLSEARQGRAQVTLASDWSILSILSSHWLSSGRG